MSGLTVNHMRLTYEIETVNCDMEYSRVLSEGFAEQENTRMENKTKSQYETVNCELEYARVLSEGLAYQEKAKVENKCQYETVNCEMDYAKVLSEGLHDQEKTFTEISEDDYDYYQALAKFFKEIQ